ncbi:hypothetical protein JCM19235_4554 [Vibrio maritimus]|uniref:Uncharacterized protein n=1 Tax=Vibrio maritimus TaxID=990268 RepID=A0A090S1I0_9VIBR|nr:hypothetical protein JCM19235_4554 [Vibrio maritimus]
MNLIKNTPILDNDITRFDDALEAFVRLFAKHLTTTANL